MNELVKLSAARRAVAEAKSVDELKHIRNQAEAIRYAAIQAGMGLDIINDAAEIKLRAERRAGGMLAEMEKNKGGQPEKNQLQTVTGSPPTLDELGITRGESHRWQAIAAVSQSVFDEQIENIKAASERLTSAGMVRLAKEKQVRDNLESIEAQEAKAVEGVYDVIVIDPPWPMEKIERDVAPNQVAFEYPTMSIDEISQLTIPCADDCHVFLWATHKFMPSAFGLLATWDMKYVCTFVWHKPGGFQPFGLPQYNCEFVLYARRGTPKFVDTKNFPVCFSAPRGAHSEKPDGFYEVLRRVTAGRRLDMFNRRKIDGFDGWGKEAK